MICPVHQKPLKDGQYGPYCTVMVGVGMPGANARGYCSYKPPKPKPELTTGAVLLQENLAGRPAGVHPKAAALAFAASLYQGSTDTMTALQAADAALEWLRQP